LRIASGCTPVLNGVSLRLFGKDRPVKKGQHLVTTLVETGEWVALTEGFVLSEETKGKRRANEGPSEQILIKVAEGPATQKIEQHLKAMERAALAEQLKLTSKAVGGKRTLMVDGTKAAHERVKLMVRELSEKGESQMLTKALGYARGTERPAGAEDVRVDIPEAPRPKPEVVLATPTPGVISKPPVPNVGASADAENEKAKASKTSSAVPAMRHLPAPKLTKPASGESGDLFSGLPAPEFPPGGTETTSSATSASENSTAGASFPPVPPSIVEGGDLFAGLPAATTEAATATPGVSASDGVTE